MNKQTNVIDWIFSLVNDNIFSGRFLIAFAGSVPFGGGEVHCRMQKLFLPRVADEVVSVEMQTGTFFGLEF